MKRLSPLATKTLQLIKKRMLERPGFTENLYSALTAKSDGHDPHEASSNRDRIAYMIFIEAYKACIAPGSTIQWQPTEAASLARIAANALFAELEQYPKP